MSTDTLQESGVGSRKVIVVVLLIVSCMASSTVPIAYANAEYKQTVYNNVFDMTMLVSELHDAGKDFIGSQKDHKKIVEVYIDHMAAQNVSWYLRLFNLIRPGLDPKKQLSSALAILSEGEGEDNNLKTKNIKAEKKIEAAKIYCASYLAKLRDYCGQEVILATPPKTNQAVVEGMISEFDSAQKRIEKFLANQTVENSEKVCQAHRVVISNLYLLRFAYQDYLDWDRIVLFRRDMNQMIHYNRKLRAAESMDDDQKGLLDSYSESELRRLKILQFIIEGKHLEAHKLLQDAINEHQIKSDSKVK